MRALAVPAGWGAWWGARRSLHAPTESTSDLACAPAATTLQRRVEVAATRGAVAARLATAKGEVGRDQDAGRKWTGGDAHLTLALLAHACLSVPRAQAVGSDGQTGGPWTWPSR